MRFAKYLSTFGMKETGERILNDPSVLHENDFNPTKTWIEYINRVIGVIIGFLIFAVFLYLLEFRKTESRLNHGCSHYVSFSWLSGMDWFVCGFHQFNTMDDNGAHVSSIAYCCVADLSVHQSSFEREINSSLGFWWLTGLHGGAFGSDFNGHAGREAVDQVAASAPRAWISNLGTEFIIHRSFSWIVLILHVGLIVRLYKTEGLKAFALTLILLILGTILTGMGMAYFAVPAFLQPVHLLLATVTFGMQFVFLLRLNRKTEIFVLK